MPDREKVIKGLELCTFEGSIEYCIKEGCPYLGGNGVGYCIDNLMRDALALLKALEQEPITGETSDGYHTFNELYHHRAVLFSVIVANYPERAWKSKKHHDGTMYDNMFIVGIDTPDGQATYHYDVDPYWDMFKCRVLDNAPEWDGHTPAQAIERIGKLKAHEPRVMTLEELLSLKENTPVYVENCDGLHGWDVFAGPDYDDGYEYVMTGAPWAAMDYWPQSEYNDTWRCWTSRPTEEQQKAVKCDDLY